jgi:hypothetical protein
MTLPGIEDWPDLLPGIHPESRDIVMTGSVKTASRLNRFSCCKGERRDPARTSLLGGGGDKEIA